MFSWKFTKINENVSIMTMLELRATCAKMIGLLSS